jgi:hypothetical protein
MKYRCKECGTELEIPPAEVSKAKARIAQLDALAPRCGFGKNNFELTIEEIRAQERYNAILKEQTTYENKYC